MRLLLERYPSDLAAEQPGLRRMRAHLRRAQPGRGHRQTKRRYIKRQLAAVPGGTGIRFDITSPAGWPARRSYKLWPALGPRGWIKLRRQTETLNWEMCRLSLRPRKGDNQEVSHVWAYTMWRRTRRCLNDKRQIRLIGNVLSVRHHLWISIL